MNPQLYIEVEPYAHGHPAQSNEKIMSPQLKPDGLYHSWHEWANGKSMRYAVALDMSKAERVVWSGGMLATVSFPKVKVPVSAYTFAAMKKSGFDLTTLHPSP